jgi:hypothetical protein
MEMVVTSFAKWRSVTHALVVILTLLLQILAQRYAEMESIMETTSVMMAIRWQVMDVMQLVSLSLDGIAAMVQVDQLIFVGHCRDLSLLELLSQMTMKLS